MNTPIAMFAFNRPDHLSRSLMALAACPGSSLRKLTIFCDGPRSAKDEEACRRVRLVAESVVGFQSVRVLSRNANLGCAGSVISGLELMFQENARVIVMEDDIICQPGALAYLEACLDKYADFPTVFQASAWAPPGVGVGRNAVPAYPYDAYFVPRFHCWGWATWRDRWRLVDWEMKDYQDFREHARLEHAYSQGGSDLPKMLRLQIEGRINSWAIRMDFSRFKHGGLGVHPLVSLVHNIGFDGTGTHCHADVGNGEVVIGHHKAELLPNYVFIEEGLARQYKNYYDTPTMAQRIIRKINRVVRRR